MVPAGLVVAGTGAPASVFFTRDDADAVVRDADGKIELATDAGYILIADATMTAAEESKIAR